MYRYAAGVRALVDALCPDAPRDADDADDALQHAVGLYKLIPVYP